jgi:hypothetical protein
MTGGLSERAVAFGQHASVAASLFEIEGKWSTDEVDPAVAVHFARQSRYHGWHSELWSELLPDSLLLRDVAVVEAPDSLWSQQLDVVAGATDTVARLALLYRSVVPRVIDATRCLVDELNPISDAAAIRSAAFVASDLEAEQSAGSLLLEGSATVIDPRDALSEAAAVDIALSHSKFGRCGA